MAIYVGMATDLSSDIATSAQGPKKASGDSGSVEQYSIKEKIEADRYGASKAAAAASKFPIALVRLRQPDANGR